MEPWRAWWCLYNSDAFSSLSSLALLGMLALVIPTLFTLPKVSEPKDGKSNTPYIDLREARQRVRNCGVVAILASLVPPIVYGLLLTQLGGETCDVKISVKSLETIYLYLTILYFATLGVLILYGFFYIFLQDMRKKHEALSEDL